MMPFSSFNQQLEAYREVKNGLTKFERSAVYCSYFMLGNHSDNSCIVSEGKAVCALKMRRLLGGHCLEVHLCDTVVILLLTFILTCRPLYM